MNEDTVNLTAESGSTLLMLAVSATDADAKMVKFLINLGADVNLGGAIEHARRR